MSIDIDGEIDRLVAVGQILEADSHRLLGLSGSLALCLGSGNLRLYLLGDKVLLVFVHLFVLSCVRLVGETLHTLLESSVSQSVVASLGLLLSLFPYLLLRFLAVGATEIQAKRLVGSQSCAIDVEEQRSVAVSHFATSHHHRTSAFDRLVFNRVVVKAFAIQLTDATFFDAFRNLHDCSVVLLVSLRHLRVEIELQEFVRPFTIIIYIKI